MSAPETRWASAGSSDPEGIELMRLTAGKENVTCCPWIWAVFVVTLVELGLCVPAFADSNEPDGTVVALEPVVMKVFPDPPEELQQSAGVNFGERIKTTERAWVTILINPISLNLGANTELVLNKPADKFSFYLDVGILLSLSRKLITGILVETPAGQAELNGTIVELEVSDDGTTIVRVYEGSATVEGAGKKRVIRAGSQTLVKPGKPPLPPSPLSPYDPSLLLRLPPDVEFEDPPLLDPIDPRVDPRKP